MLCFVLLCFVFLSIAMLRIAMLRVAILCIAILCIAMLRIALHCFSFALHCSALRYFSSLCFAWFGVVSHGIAIAFKNVFIALLKQL